MKQIITLLAVLAITMNSFAQSPEKFSYQAVVRDNGDALVANAVTPIQISILQTTASGTAVYVETQTPTTNANGLLSIVIGEGTVVSGSFSTIAWGFDAFYIKTEVDVDNNASYDVTGTSQLLSVPYALNANTLTGGIDQAYIDALEARIEALEAMAAQPAVVGDYRDGGVVFWVDPLDNTHGLVCAVSDQAGSSTVWGCYGTDIPGSVPSAIGSGASNTAAIVAGCPTPGIAAEIASNLSLNGYTDWFIPSKDELNEMYLNQSAVNATAIANGGVAFSSYYWTSTQDNANNAWYQFMFNGMQALNAKANGSWLRCVRAF